MAWVRLSDASGGCEVTFFSEVLSRSREILAAGNAVVVSADLKLEGEALRITASDVMELEQAAAEAAAELRIWFDQAAALEPIRDVLHGIGGGRGRVILLPSVAETRDVELTLAERYRVTPRVAQMIKAIEGVGRVEQF